MPNTHNCTHCGRKFATAAGFQKHTCKDASGAPIFTGTRLNHETGLVELTSSTPHSKVEVVTEAEVTEADLRASAERVNLALETIRSHEGAMFEATLEHRLCIGLEIAKAQQVFGLSRATAGELGGRPTETVPRRGKVSEKPAVLSANLLGFSNWIKKQIPDLKRSTAQKYATAFGGTGLALDDATPQKIKEVVKKLRHQHGKDKKPMPKLEDFYKLGKPPKPTALIAAKPVSSKQLKLEDARETFHRWKEDFEKALKQGHLDHLDKKGLEDLQEFTATVRDRIKTRLK